MTGDPNDPLDDILSAPVIIGPRRPVTIATGIKLAKIASIEKKLAKAQADYDRWLEKMLRAAKRVDTARIMVRRYGKLLAKERE